MNQSRRVTTGWILATILAACSPSPPPSEPEVAPEENISAPPPAAEPSSPQLTALKPSPQAGSMIVYVCDDKSGLTVTYDENSALVKLPAGSTMLSRAEAASNNGSEAYMGEELSLFRSGNIVQLQEGGKLRICTQSPTSG